MPNKKRLLIIYASAGEGHRRAGEAIFKYLKEKIDKEVSIIDALDFSNFLFKRFYRNGYSFLVKNLPFLWRIAYTISRFKFSKSIRFIVNRLNMQRLENYILEYKPDIILSTHFLSIEVVDYLKRKKFISSESVVVITDFGVHHYWVFRSVDKYMVAFPSTKEELILFGIKEDKISVTGIPVDLKFSINLNRDFLYKKFNLKEGLFTVLIVTAGFGLGPIDKLVEILSKEIQLIVICGYNLRLYKRLERRNYQNVRLFGFVENMEELMDVSDMIITKPGGLTISEALVKKLPMIFISPIFGQEIDNIKILRKMGIGLVLEDIYKIKDFILRCKSDPKILSLMKQKISQIRKPLAVKEIVDALC
ncbi:MAG: hypothetical protein NC900_06245 [Candidatus Omnitrophica bacterium]|nr:hypothetical protein [Candidatus Omnitrophota bacterium]